MSEVIKRTLLNARMINDNVHIKIPNTTTEQELSFVISRTIYSMVVVYAEENHMPFDKALELYMPAIYADVGRQYDMEHPNVHRHNKSHKPR